MRWITRVNLKVIGADGALSDRRRQSGGGQAAPLRHRCYDGYGTLFRHVCTARSLLET